MYVVSVELTICAGAMDRFVPLMRENAAASLRDEPGCLQFDVVRCEAAPNLILLWEVYTDAAAFAAHLKTPHFLAFDAAVADMVAAKTVRTGPRLHPS